MRRILGIGALAFLILLPSSPAVAEVADVLPVGGVLTDHDNEPLDGAYDMTFALYDVALGGTPLWYEQRTGANQVQVSDGLFSVELGAVESLDFLDLIAASDLWLGITVGADSEADRIHLGSVPFAIEAQYCRQVVDSTCEPNELLRGWDDATGAPICEGAGRWLPVGGTSNCRLSLGGTTLTVVGSDGNALSVSNPCVVRVTDGAVAVFTAPVSTTFGVSSDTDGSSFGTTAAVAWGNEMPIFLHACDGAASDYFGFSRNPARRSTGASAGDLCQEGDDDCDAQGDLFVMSSGLSLAGEVNRPCVTVGSFRATKNASDAWTVTTLVSGQDGFGVFQEGMRFTFPMGQNGASSGSYFSKAGLPTTLSFSSMYYSWWQYQNGEVEVSFSTGNMSAADAASTNFLYIHIPLAAKYSASNNGSTNVGYSIVGGGSLLPLAVLSSTNNYFFFYDPSTGAIIKTGDITGGTDQIRYVNIKYRAF